MAHAVYFSNFGSLKSTETTSQSATATRPANFSNFGSLKSTETARERRIVYAAPSISAISAR